MENRYLFIRKLGTGGQGQVFLARDNLRRGRLVALKRLHPESATGAFLATEFSQLAKLRHPNIARAYDYAVDAEGPYYTSEFVDGLSFLAFAAQAQEAQLLVAAASLLRVLALLHERDLVHGDLSPDNVLIDTGSPPAMVLKLIDLGGARRPGQMAAVTTPGFTAPEVLLGQGLSPASDLYSFGALLASAVFGQSPFGLGSASAVVQRQLGKTVALPPADLHPLAPLLTNLLCVDPTLRPKSALVVLGELATHASMELGLHLHNLDPSELPEPKFVDRNAARAALAGLLDGIGNHNQVRTARIFAPTGGGKTRLLSELASEAQVNGFIVIGQPGACSGAGEFLRAIAHATAASFFDTPHGKFLAPWARESDAAAPSVFAPSWRDAVCFAAAQALAVTADAVPVCLLVDDFDAADGMMQALVGTIARTLSVDRAKRPPALLFIGSALDLDDAKWSGFESLAISLPPLDRPAVIELVHSMLPGVICDPAFPGSVYVAADGLPGKAVGLVHQAAGPGGNRAINSAIEETVHHLPQAQRSLMAALSFAPRPIPLDFFSAEKNCAWNIEELNRLGLVEEVQTLGGYAIRADKTAGSIAANLADPSDLKNTVAALAEGFYQAQYYDLAGALWMQGENLSAAQDAFTRHALHAVKTADFASASDAFERALFACGAHPAANRLGEEAQRVWRAVGRYDLAEKGISLIASTEIERESWRARLTLEQGRHREALQIAQQAIPLAPGDLDLACTIAMAQLQLGKHENALRTVKAARAERLETAPADSLLLAQLALVGAIACTYLSRIEEAQTFLSAADSGFALSADAEGMLRVLGAQGMLYRKLGDLTKAHEMYDRAVAAARAMGDLAKEGLNLLNRATIRVVQGEISAARQDYLLALDIAIIQGAEFLRAQVELNLADLLSGVGAQAQAIHTAQLAVERCRKLGQERLETRALLLFATALLRAGDLRRAEAKLSEVRRRYSASSDRDGELVADLHRAALLLAQNRPDEALAVAAKTVELAAKLKRSAPQARALVLMARALRALGRDREKALVHLGVAQTLFNAERLPDEVWRLHYHQGVALEELGRTDAAATAFATATELYRGLLQKVPADLQAAYASFEEAPQLTARWTHSPNDSSGERHPRDLQRLMEINRELTKERDPKRLLALIMERAVELTGAERGMVVLPKEHSLEPVIAFRISDETDLSFSRSVAEKVVAENRTLLAIDALGDERFCAFASVHAMKLRSILAAPLRIRRQVAGVIYLDSRLKSGAFTAADANLLEAFAAQAAITLETARLISENTQRYTELQQANEEIRSLSSQLEKKFEQSQATLERVGALLHQTQADEANRLRTSGIVGRSAALQRVAKLVSRIAITDVPVYIYGASGTGKELVAKAIHASSGRDHHPFVPVNCGALPAKLLASELFGYKRGAFTGAVRDKPGLFALADQGTLFLDEVTDMDVEMQTHLLRVLQEGAFRPLGGQAEVSVNVRIVSASNRRLADEVKAGRFREDLFYRLNVLSIEVPSLAERREDIPLLVEHFVARHFGDAPSPPVFSKEALQCLAAAPWPGNVRELENELLRAAALSTPGVPIGPGDLSANLIHAVNTFSQIDSAGALSDQVDAFERLIIEEALKRTNGNATLAAKQLRISRAGLYKKLTKLGGVRGKSGG